MITLDSKNEKTTASWMPCPAINLEYPGLAYIYPLDELLVVQQTDAFHEIIGEKNSTGYTIFNNLGQKVFLAVEKTRFKRCRIKIFNHYGNQVIEVERPFRLCKKRVLISAPPGNFVGALKELRTCRNTFTVKNWYGLVFLKIKKVQGFLNFDYEVMSYETVVGKLTNNVKDTTVRSVKNFAISFPMDMHVLDKAVVVGACFFIGCLKYRR